MEYKRRFFWLLLLTVSYSAMGQINPVSDPENSQKWVLNKWVSDEFNGSELNKTKWWILGENNDYRNKWKGRAPGQFAPQNVKVEGGKLILTSQWEPSFLFANETNDGYYYGGSATAADLSSPITQACVMSETFFQYGYMEIKCKIADAPVTSAFWTTGYHSEIDMVENYGKRPIGNPENRPTDLENKYRTNLISWDPDQPEDHKDWKVEKVMDVRMAADYYIFGFEWDKEYVKTYFNGQLIQSATREELEAKNQWKHDYPQEIWFDSEVFRWYGLPTQQDLTTPAEFLIDYVRIWQKEETKSFFDALSFEGPFYFNGRSINWWSGKNSYWRMKSDKALTGDFSLRFQHEAPFNGDYSIFSPYGSIDLPEGANSIAFSIWIDESTSVDELDIILNKPFTTVTIDISNVEKGKWIKIETPFSRSSSSDTNIINGDRLQIKLKSSNIKSNTALIYIDDIAFKASNNGATPEYPFPDDTYPEQEYPDSDIPTGINDINKVNWDIYPNPTSTTFTVKSILNGSIKIYNSTGVLIQTISKNNQDVIVPIQGFTKGIYYVVFETIEHVVTRRLIIE
ncbi:T9SS type A sorting domain-containing protein [Flammeovirga pectinis]|uniref:T9SS type A sorting domain-containing protein n=1 Tax=Flammeovirga pectinis TaxID=2494373 RepID=A0A3Q9FMW2_9BACT|nr:T9SS type A sorting domain-containing protein [Flammeovirga pectinis]AZQ63190.1 T9SS type A sorting domain-containing protein [Flammeovirga pectinis]